MTLENVVFHNEGRFYPYALVYVAVTRTKNPESLVLAQPLTDEMVTNSADAQVDAWYRDTVFNTVKPEDESPSDNVETWDFIDLGYRECQKLESVKYQKFSSVPKELVPKSNESKTKTFCVLDPLF